MTGFSKISLQLLQQVIYFSQGQRFGLKQTGIAFHCAVLVNGGEKKFAATVCMTIEKTL